MVDIGAALERQAENADDAADTARELFTETRKSKRDKKNRQQKKRRQSIIRGVAWLGAIAVGLGVAFGYLNTVISPWAAGIAFAAFVGLAWALGENDDEVSITFGLSAVAVGVLLVEYVLPGWVVTPVAESVLGWLPGDLFAGWSAVEFAVLAFAMIAVWWFIDIRFISRSGVKPATVAKRFGSRAENMIEQYLSVVRVSIMVGIGIGFFILSELGMITGEIGGYAAEAPYAAADLLTIGLGYLALGGEVPFLEGVPFLESIGTGGWLIITGAVLVVAVGVANAD